MHLHRRGPEDLQADEARMVLHKPSPTPKALLKRRLVAFGHGDPIGYDDHGRLLSIENE
jgi:hypothetical protein